MPFPQKPAPSGRANVKGPAAAAAAGDAAGAQGKAAANPGRRAPVAGRRGWWSGRRRRHGMKSGQRVNGRDGAPAEESDPDHGQ